MILIQLVHFRNAFDILKRVRNFNPQKFSFYSEFNGNIFYYILKRSCYIIKKDSMSLGVIFVDRIGMNLYYIPFECSAVSFFRLLYLIKQNFNLSGFRLSVKHKNLNSNLYKNSFFIDVVIDIKCMEAKAELSDIEAKDVFKELSVLKLVIGKEEGIRVELQNRIFSEVKNRRELTIGEVLREEKSPGFLKGMCYILRYCDTPIGYGQILYTDEKFYLVNFGITPEYRKAGYGNFFLTKIMNNCSLYGINNLYLTVDKQNVPAIGLYKKVGFKDLYNKLEIILK
jgi:ribosomal protein S18 acetylase RimI-like enzyme